MAPEKRAIAVVHLDWLHPEAQDDKAFDARLSGSTRAVADLYGLGAYRKVATVRAADLSEAFEVTQNGEEIAWIKKPGVQTEELAESCRSTSVGDLFVVDGQAYIVQGLGFGALPIPVLEEHKP